MTDKTELEVTLADMDAAAKASGFDTWADAVYWSNLAKQSAVQNLAEAFARHRLATRTPDPTPVALSDEEAFRQMHLLYNYIDDDSIQFTRWQMVVAMSHGMRLAHPPAAPADGLVDAILDKLHHELEYPTEACALVRIALAAYRGEA